MTGYKNQMPIPPQGLPDCPTGARPADSRCHPSISPSFSMGDPHYGMVDSPLKIAPKRAIQNLVSETQKFQGLIDRLTGQTIISNRLKGPGVLVALAVLFCHGTRKRQPIDSSQGSAGIPSQQKGTNWRCQVPVIHEFLNIASHQNAAKAIPYVRGLCLS